jgi:hypothetical protein
MGMSEDKQIESQSAAFELTVDASSVRPFHQGSRHKLHRGLIAGRPVVMKTTAASLPTAHAVASMRHEFEILSHLDIAGTVRAIMMGATSDGLSLVLEDVGAASLAD